MNDEKDFLPPSDKNSHSDDNNWNNWMYTNTFTGKQMILLSKHLLTSLLVISRQKGVESTAMTFFTNCDIII